MIGKFYTTIHIQNNHFYIEERKAKPCNGLALITLQAIENIIEKQLEYEKYSEDDPFLSNSRYELYGRLRQRAQLIHQGFMKKSGKLGYLKRLFGGVSKKEATVESCYRRILSLPSSLPKEPIPQTPVDLIQNLPAELIQYTLSFLPVRDLKQVAQVSKFLNPHAKYMHLKRAREYLYKGNDLEEGAQWVELRLNALSTLAHHGCIPEEYVIYNNGRIDPEATLRNLRHLNGDKRRKWIRDLHMHFLRCAENGAMHLLEALHNFKVINVNVRNSKGQTALSLSIRYPNVTKKLIEMGADPNLLCNQGLSPLAYLLELQGSRYEKLMIFLMEKGAQASILIPNQKWKTLLFFAVEKKKVHLLSQFLKHGAKEIIDETDEMGRTALHLAAEQGNRNMVLQLLDGGASINLQTHSGRTPLSLSIEHTEVVQLLLDRDADPTIACNQGKTPLMYAMTWWGRASLEILIEKGADLTTAAPHFTLLNYAANKGDTSLVYHILKYAPPDLIHQPDQLGYTPLHHAAFRGNHLLVMHLIEKGALIDVSASNGRTPLSLAFHHPEVVKFLLAKGANPNSLCTQKGYSPLMYALENYNKEECRRVAQELVVQGANTTLLFPKTRETLLHYAANKGYLLFVKHLLHHGGQKIINNRDVVGQTALHKAAQQADPAIAAELLAAGADKDLSDNQGKTPLALTPWSHFHLRWLLRPEINYSLE